jgi:tellurite resistance protein TerC
MADRFAYLPQGLAVILAFIGVKMLLIDLWHVPVWLSLSVIASVLALSVLLSLRTTASSRVEAYAGRTV